MSLPVLITGLMITGATPERAAMAKIAAQLFYAQTWPNLQLIVVNQGDWEVTDYDPRTTEIKVSRETLTLGELRTIALKNAAGTYCIHWDDDDWVQPNYLDYLMSHAPGINEAAVLKTELRYSVPRDTACYCSLPAGQRHPLFLRLSAPPVYPPLNRLEDYGFLQGFQRVVVLPNPKNMYVRIYHGDNVLGENDFFPEPMPVHSKTIDPADERLLVKIKQRYSYYGNN